MIRLVYLSAARPTLSQGDLEQILSVARDNNKASGITGLLLYGRGSFIQVLEGEAADVEACYDRICNDQRHSAVLAVVREPIRSRAFGEWSMGYRKLKGDERGLESLIDMRDSSALGPVKSNLPGVVTAFIESFGRTNIDA